MWVWELLWASMDRKKHFEHMWACMDRKEQFRKKAPTLEVERPEQATLRVVTFITHPGMFVRAFEEVP
jgi:hypothetical protein